MGNVECIQVFTELHSTTFCHATALFQNRYIFHLENLHKITQNKKLKSVFEILENVLKINKTTTKK